MNKSNAVAHLSAPRHLSASECNSALEVLAEDKAQLLKLNEVARYRAGNDLEAEELVQEAFTRVLDGDRAWPRDLTALPFLIQVVRSIASECRDKRDRRKPHAATMEGPLTPTPAEMLENIQQDAAMRARVLEHFGDDPELQVLIEALLEGWEKDDLLSLFDHDTTKYATVRRRLRRKLNKLRMALPQTGEHHDKDYVREADER